MLTERENFAGPGQDTRQWVSYGIVDDDTEDQKAVTFDEDYGPLVSVTLQPSGTPVRCRVGGSCAGNGEGEYFPFLGGDECVVVIFEGDEKADPMIVGRGNNQIDKWPTVVGGQDVTKNSVAFKRVRCPYILESASSLLFRAATAGNFLLLEASGNATLADGFHDFVHVGIDFVGMQASDADGAPTLLVQLDKNNNLVTLEAAGAGKFLISGDGTGSWFQTDTVSIGAGGQVAGEHVTTVEAMANLLTLIVVGLGTAGVGGLSALSAPPAAQALVTAAITAAGAAGLTPVVTSAIHAALAAKLQNTTGLKPSVGCPSFLAG